VNSETARRFREIRALVPESVTLIAVSKTHPFEQIKTLYDLGHRDFGENYVQELLSKAEAARELGMTDIRWHMIGHLQSNKVKLILPIAFCIHTVDSIKLAQEIQKRAVQPVSILLEVNIDHEETKSGFMPEEVNGAAKEISQLPNISLKGLMCIPQPSHHGDSFHRLKELEKSLHPLTQGALSMGMSDDFKSAIQSGSTHVRIGSAIFGTRL